MAPCALPLHGERLELVHAHGVLPRLILLRRSRAARRTCETRPSRHGRWGRGIRERSVGHLLSSALEVEQETGGRVHAPSLPPRRRTPTRQLPPAACSPVSSAGHQMPCHGRRQQVGRSTLSDCIARRRKYRDRCRERRGSEARAVCWYHAVAFHLPLSTGSSFRGDVGGPVLDAAASIGRAQRGRSAAADRD